MQDFLVLGYIPGTHIQITFQLWAIAGLSLVAIGLIWAIFARTYTVVRKDTIKPVRSVSRPATPIPTSTPEQKSISVAKVPEQQPKTARRYYFAQHLRSALGAYPGIATRVSVAIANYKPKHNFANGVLILKALASRFKTRSVQLLKQTEDKARELYAHYLPIVIPYVISSAKKFVQLCENIGEAAITYGQKFIIYSFSKLFHKFEA